MLIKNTDETLVNGSVGKVIGFYDQAAYNRMLVGAGEEPQAPVEDTKSSSKKKKESAGSAGQPVYPLVRFPIANGGGYRDMLMVPETWKVELPNGEVQASRTQVRYPSVLCSDVFVPAISGDGKTSGVMRMILSESFAFVTENVSCSASNALASCALTTLNRSIE